MSAQPKYFFDDGVSYTDRSTFIDYPQIKIRSFGTSRRNLIKTIIIYIDLILIISGSIYLYL